MPQKAGIIRGNALCGLNERICINARKVYDGCITRYSDRSFTLSFSTELSGTSPYTYVEARSSGTSTVENLVITPTTCNKSRVQMNVVTPVTVTYTDANNETYTATSSITIARDIVLKLPEDSLTSYTIEVATNLASTIGSFTDDAATITACVVQITRVLVNVDVLIPSYGYCEYPTCQEYSDEVCRELFNLPIFPTNT